MIEYYMIMLFIISHLILNELTFGMKSLFSYVHLYTVIEYQTEEGFCNNMFHKKFTYQIDIKKSLLNCNLTAF